MDTRGQGEWDKLGVLRWHTCTPMCKTDRRGSCRTAGPSSVLCADLGAAGRETQEESQYHADIELTHCKTETKTARQSDFTPATTKTKRRQGGEPKLELIISFFKVRTPINSTPSTYIIYCNVSTFLRYVPYWNYEIISLDIMVLLWKLPLEKEGHLRSQGNSDLAARKGRVSRFGESTRVTAKQEWRAGWWMKREGAGPCGPFPGREDSCFRMAAGTASHCELSIELGWRRKNLSWKSYLKKNMGEMVGRRAYFTRLQFSIYYFIQQRKSTALQRIVGFSFDNSFAKWC